MERARKVRPDAIAVEIVPEALEAYCEAVRRFPSLSGLVTPDDELVPIIPTDSIAQAVRYGMEQGLPIHAVDIPRSGPGPEDPGNKDRIAPVLLAEEMGLQGYYHLASGLTVQAPAGSADDRRERTMALRLAELAQEHEGILFVCGLAHWGAIKRHLADGCRRTRRPRPKEYRLVHLTARAAYRFTGQIPFVIGQYETMKRRERFIEGENLPRLFMEAGRRIRRRLGSADYALLNRYGRNLAMMEKRLSPSLFEMTFSAKTILSDEYAARVYEEGMRYPFGEIRTRGPRGLPILDVDEKDRETLDGNERSFKLWTGRKKISIKRVVTLGRDPSKERHHPEGDEKGGKAEKEIWGRFKDEMLSEERFIDYVRRFALQSLSSMEWETEPFSTGMRDGLDVRRTIRDPQRRIWVKTLEKEPGDVGAVLVEWDETPGGEETYTYGAHRALGLSRVLGEGNPGVELCDWSSLLSFARRMSPDELRVTFDEWRRESAWGGLGESGGPAPGLRKIAIEKSRGPVVVFATARKPRARERRLAAASGRRLVHIPIERLAAEALEGAKRHHWYWREGLGIDETTG